MDKLVCIITGPERNGTIKKITNDLLKYFQ